MKVYSCPNEVPAPQIDFKNYDQKKVEADERAHMEKLKDWLVGQGYKGPHTGGILALPWADGKAQYMFGDGRSPILIHLPYGDAWHNPDVQYLPKDAVIDRIVSFEKMQEMFKTA